MLDVFLLIIITLKYLKEIKKRFYALTNIFLLHDLPQFQSDKVSNIFGSTLQQVTYQTESSQILSPRCFLK